MIDFQRLARRLGDFLELLVLQLVEMIAERSRRRCCRLRRERAAGSSDIRASRGQPRPADRSAERLRAPFVTSSSACSPLSAISSSVMGISRPVSSTAQKVAVFVEISDDRMACDANVLLNCRQAELPFEVIRQRLRFCEEVLK